MAAALDHLASRLGADADPVQPRMRGQGAVALDRDGKAARMERVDQRVVDLEHRFPAGQHDIAPVPPLAPKGQRGVGQAVRSEEHTSELQSLMRISYAVFCLKKKTKTKQ